MEKFSTWRDPSNGIAPFVLPVPTGSDVAPAVRLAAGALQAVFASARLLLLLLWIAAYYVLDTLVNYLFIASPAVGHRIRSILAAILMRTALCVCFGYLSITEEHTAAKRRAAPGQVAMPQAGDMIISNWSSFVDVLYLAHKYNPVFAVPVTGTAGGETRYLRKSLFGLLAITGQVPSITQSDAARVHKLEAIIASASVPTVVLPEGTTSNNRAILRFKATTSCSLPSSRSRVFIHVIKHDAPTLYRPTVTCPVPSSVCNPVPQIFRACMSPFFLQRQMLVRILAASDAPTTSSGTFWNQVADSMCAVGKIKQTSNLGADEKVSFMEYYSKPKSRESAVKGKKRS